MAELVGQFEEALQNIEPSDDDKQNASEAHQEVRDAERGSGSQGVGY